MVLHVTNCFISPWLRPVNLFFDQPDCMLLLSWLLMVSTEAAVVAAFNDAILLEG